MRVAHPNLCAFPSVQCLNFSSLPSSRLLFLVLLCNNCVQL
uniref:Uncharacterized protein n=1 Tax=Anguilla anguilla TaxID=7936 RepID=A0A0E9RYE3_ANGAN